MTLPSLDEIRKKVDRGLRLSAADGEFLFRDDVDLETVGQLADVVRRRKNGNAVHYNINMHLNPTNVCIYRCTLCAYSRDDDDPRSFTLDDQQILARGREAVAGGCTELHIVSGVHPSKPYDWYLGIITLLHQAFPRLHLKAWSAVEIARFAEISKRSIRVILQDMIRAGLGSLPGGGAEIFDPEVRTQICPRKADARTWLGIHRMAHQLGLRSNATMLYGHVESTDHRIDHLVQLRQLQDVTGGFQCFVPLSFHPDNTNLGHIVKPSQELDLRIMAVSRLMLDNFDHIKAYWISLGLDTARKALDFGADDFDGTVRYERIHHDAGACSPEALSVDDLCRIIRDAGREPVERDTLYRRVKRDGVKWTLA